MSQRKGMSLVKHTGQEKEISLSGVMETLQVGARIN